MPRTLAASRCHGFGAARPLVLGLFAGIDGSSKGCRGSSSHQATTGPATGQTAAWQAGSPWLHAPPPPSRRSAKHP